VSISGIELLGVMYRRFPLTHEIIHGENVLKFMSSLYVILFYKFVCNYLM
jgi:hypothetical protein